jgi:hypothetical protein
MAGLSSGRPRIVNMKSVLRFDFLIRQAARGQSFRKSGSLSVVKRLKYPFQLEHSAQCSNRNIQPVRPQIATRW